MGVIVQAYHGQGVQVNGSGAQAQADRRGERMPLGGVRGASYRYICLINSPHKKGLPMLNWLLNLFRKRVLTPSDIVQLKKELSDGD